MQETINSNIPWVGEIPITWKIEQGKHFMTCLDRPVKEDDGVITCFRDGEVTLRSKRREDGFTISFQEFGYQGIEPGDLVVHGMDGFAGAIGISDSRGKATPVLTVLDTNQDKRYMMYALRNMAYTNVFLALSTGIRVRSCDTSWKKIKELRYALPPLNEQKQIADQIEIKCSQVNSLIANQEAQIEKLKKYKQSLICQVVMRGLDSNSSLRDSGIDWMGSIPANWMVVRGKAVLKQLSRQVRQDDEVITCFRDGEVTLRKNRREEGFTFSEKEIGYQGIEPGDLVIHGMDGFAGAIGVSSSRGKGSPVLIVCDSAQNKKYLSYYLQSLAYRDIFLALSTGIRVRSCDLRWSKLSVLPFLVPPIDDQVSIVTYLDKALNTIDDLISVKKIKVEKLRQYKKSLIYEYVTGKKEVKC